MIKTNLGLVAFAERALSAGTGYVYGTIGQTCTASLLDDCARRYPANNLAGGAMRTVGNKWIGRRVTDCIGLLKYYVMSDGYGDNPRYITKYDQSANGAYNQATDKGPINALPEIPGICLHMPGHFGVYVGGGWAIEARGTVYGVVKTRVRDRPWTAWFRSPWIEYVEDAAVKSDTTMDMTLSPGKSYIVKLTAAAPPSVTIGTGGILRHELYRQIGSDYLYRLTAIGQPGQVAGVYVNGKRIFAVTIVK